MSRNAPLSTLTRAPPSSSLRSRAVIRAGLTLQTDSQGSPPSVCLHQTWGLSLPGWHHSGFSVSSFRFALCLRQFPLLCCQPGGDEELLLAAACKSPFIAVPLRGQPRVVTLSPTLSHHHRGHVWHPAMGAGLQCEHTMLPAWRGKAGSSPWKCQLCLYVLRTALGACHILTRSTSSTSGGVERDQLSLVHLCFQRWAGFCLADNLRHEWRHLQLVFGLFNSFPMSSFPLNPVSPGRRRMSPPWSVGSNDLLVLRHLPCEHTVVLQTLTNSKPLQIILEQKYSTLFFFFFSSSHITLCNVRAFFLLLVPTLTSPGNGCY